MPYSAIGVKYADKIHDAIQKEIEQTGVVPEHYDWELLVSKYRRQDAYDTYVELEYAPPIDPPGWKEQQKEEPKAEE